MQIFELFSKAMEGPIVKQNEKGILVQVTNIEPINAGMFDVNTVHFKVIKGHLNESDAYDYMTEHATSISSFHFNIEKQFGTFIDKKSEFGVGDILTRD